LELAPFNDEAVGTFAREWYEREYGETNVFAFVGMVQDVSLGPLYKGFVVHPTVSTKSQHPWRATTFDQRGFIGHQYYETIEKAIAQELRITKSAKPNPKLFERIVMREEFQEGNRRSLMLNRSAPDNALATRLVDLINRHYGPGPHPGTGTSQDVHGDGVKVPKRPKMLRMSSAEAAEKAAELKYKYKKEGQFFDITFDDDGFILFLDREAALEWWAEHDRKLDYEVSRMFDGNKMVFVKKGTKNKIEHNMQDQFAIVELREKAEAKGQVLISTHNHPGDAWVEGMNDYPPSFSDFQFAMGMELDEWHVITPNGKYVIRRGPKSPVDYTAADENLFISEWKQWSIDNANFYIPGVRNMTQETINVNFREDKEFLDTYIEMLDDRAIDLARQTRLFHIQWVQND
jgi:hypothetical protein